MKARLRFRLVAGLFVAGAITACVVDPLNPQPLPPGPIDDDNKSSFSPDSGGLVVSQDAGGPLTGNPADSGTPQNDLDAAPTDAPDAGDAGDAGDADADAKVN